MPSFILRDIDETFWSRVKTKAAAEGVPIKALILRLLTQWLGVAALVLVSVTGASAQTQPQRPKVFGVGVMRCADWVQPPQEATPPAGLAGLETGLKHMTVIAWATGYVTGAAAILAGSGIMLRNTTGKEIESGLTPYCQEHPQGTIEQAAAALVQSLRVR